MAEIPQWRMKGDWFDVCSCDVPCPCEFAQPPTNNHCEGVLAYHIREGEYGDIRLDGLNVLAVAQFDGNIWTGEAHPSLGLYIDARGDTRQRDALQQVMRGGVDPMQILTDEQQGLHLALTQQESLQGFKGPLAALKRIEGQKRTVLWQRLQQRQQRRECLLERGV